MFLFYVLNFFHVHLLLQKVPFSEKPELHLHTKVPGVLIHCALLSQSCCLDEHSSTSKMNKTLDNTGSGLFYSVKIKNFSNINNRQTLRCLSTFTDRSIFKISFKAFTHIHTYIFY